MKLFLRYQISGMVFIIWAVIFYHGKDAGDFKTLFEAIHDKSFDLKTLTGITAISSPIGVLIHQLSVVIKNWLVGDYLGMKEFSDHPNETPKELDYDKKSNICYLEHISSLNSFYYVRVDNGLIAPTLAFVLVALSFPISHHYFLFFLVLIALLIAIITICYVRRIGEEIREYRNRFEKKNPFCACKFKD